jgi:hypothetical protein
MTAPKSLLGTPPHSCGVLATSRYKIIGMGLYFLPQWLQGEMGPHHILHFQTVFLIGFGRLQVGVSCLKT